jgi:hypothetical protein
LTIVFAILLAVLTVAHLILWAIYPVPIA